MTIRRLFIPVIVLLAAPAVALAQAATSQPYVPIKYIFEKRLHPPRQIHIALIDLTNPAVSLQVSRGGDDPDGNGPWQTTLQPVSAIAQRQQWELAINGDFFSVPPRKEGERRYVKDSPASVTGPAMTDGQLWAESKRSRPALLVDDRGRVAIAESKDLTRTVRQIIAGSHIIVKDGKNVAPKEGSFPETNHPRTAVGIADGGNTLVLLVVDGRRLDKIGMTLSALADEFIRLGCASALNLDGGGSSAMVLRDPQTDEMKIMNSPSDGQERPVGNALGVDVAE